ncbi:MULTISPECIES: VOC family protein [unclassified Marinovum]|jgi:catechol-2,3-dioxygenase|uniref:VOC family protein n=1 Tax=unclassified Marinovum TaxID=2647166 RepID=UPI003EDBF2BE
MSDKPRLVGVNHIVLEVGDIEHAMAFWHNIFEFDVRGAGDGFVFLDLGDQFIGLVEGKSQPADANRHFGLVVDDRSRVMALAAKAGAQIMDSDFMDFRDPWGNRIQVVEYRDLQFSKTPEVLRGMGLDLDKTEAAQEELRKKGMG